jgi:hypothetical protein
MNNKTVLFIALFWLLALACSKQTDSQPEVPKPPYYVSGKYLCRDSTRNKIWTGDTPKPYYDVMYDSTYIITIDYVDTIWNTIRFKMNEYKLDSTNTYVHNTSNWSNGGIDSLRLSDNKLFYFRHQYPGGTELYTRITGTRIP